MDGVRLDPAVMASDKDPAADNIMGGAMGVPVVHGLDKAGQVLDYGGKPEAVGDQAAVAAHAEGLSKELGSLDPSLAVLMQPPAPASRAQTPPPDVAGAMMQHGLLPLPPGAEGLLGAGVGVGVPPPAGGGLLGALTAVPGGVGAGAPGSAAAAAALSKVGDLAGGIKDDKMAALDAAGKLKEQKKVGAPVPPPCSARLCCRQRPRGGDAVCVCARGAQRLRPDGKEELEKDGKKPKEGEEGDKEMMAHKLCPHNKPKATCMECTGCPHGKRRQNCKDCNAGSRQWCQHGKRRHDCHECSGCPHGRIKRCAFCSWLARAPLAGAPFLAQHVAS